jgi:hypothetical protein
MEEERRLQNNLEKPPYETPKALRLSDLDRGQGGRHGAVACISPGSGDISCEEGSLPDIAVSCINPGSSYAF